MKTPSLIDAAARWRFVNEVNNPFSVIAPAGVGKTHAIIDRVENILRQTQNNLALVTYTNKAAAEMLARLEKKISPQPMPVERLFVGTIHALCSDLIGQHALEWGLPAQFEVVGDPETLKAAYAAAVPNPLANLPEELQVRFNRYFEPLSLKFLAEIKGRAVGVAEFCAPPLLDLHRILNATAKGSTKRSLENMQSWVHDFLAATNPHAAQIPLPKRPDSETMGPLYDEVFNPLAEWKCEEGARYAAYLAEQFTLWRRKEGFYTYDDLITLVFEHAQEGYGLSVLLDEAQDASPEQLELLKKLAARRDGVLDLTMVGDPQQSIYSSRASLSHYRATYNELTTQHGAQELTFEVTFRCAQTIVGWVNNLGGTLLKGTEGQAAYVPLTPKPQAVVGGVWCHRATAQVADPKASSDERDVLAAREVIAALRTINISPQQYHQVAVLLPRKAWIETLAQELSRAGILFQIHAERDESTPPERLLKSLLHLMSYPTDRFELVGLLREFFAIDDLTLARACKEHPEALNISQPAAETVRGDLLAALTQLHSAWKAARVLPAAEALYTFTQQLNCAARLAALEPVYGQGLALEWEELLTAILPKATAQTSMASLIPQVSGLLKERTVAKGAVQLMTMHKSKGLEWPIVFLPFLYRAIGDATPTYPLNMGTPADLKLAWNTTDYDRTQKSTKSNQELERLLYVALTRAKEHLVLFDDSSLYVKNERSSADLLKLRFEQSFSAAFKALPDLAALPVAFNAPAEPLPTTQLSAATLARLSVVPQRRTPSSQVVAPAAHTGHAEGGSRYGSWWHEVWPQMNLPQAGDALEAKLLAAIPQSPFAQRAQREVDKLKNSPLWPLLTDPTVGLFCEVPFLVEIEGSIIEGRIDLIAQTATELIIIDWKTDQLPLPQLIETYRPQMIAYAAAAQKLTGKAARVTLYATAYGVWETL